MKIRSQVISPDLFAGVIKGDQRGFALIAAPDLGAAEYQGHADRVRYWPLDFDGDGMPFGVEIATGADPLRPEVDHPRWPTLTRYSLGGVEFRFGLNSDALPFTRWQVERSPGLGGPGEDFQEVYSAGQSAQGAGDSITFLTFTGDGLVLMVDGVNLPRAYYRLSAILVQPAP